MSKLFEEISFGNVTLKNRLAVAPMGTIHDMDGGVSPEQRAYLVERAKGGCGLICVEAVAVTPGGRFCKTHMGFWSDEQIAGHKVIT